MPMLINKLRTILGRIKRCAPLAGLATAIVIGAVASASADTLCKPASPATQSKCTKDSQCCAGLVCASGRCRSGCRIASTFIAGGTKNGQCRSCQPAASTTTWTNLLNGSACNDGNLCTQTDSCQAGSCVGSNPVTCVAADQCHDAGTCDPSTGLCSSPAKPNFTPCDDGIACTDGSYCQTGLCGTGHSNCANTDLCAPESCDYSSGQCVSVPVRCPEQPAPSCWTSTCNSATGKCEGRLTVVSPTCGDECTANADCPSNACVIGTCSGDDSGLKRCIYTDVSCNDGNACTLDSCDPLHGCSNYLPDPTQACNDSDSCTDDTCVPAVGCVNTPIPAAWAVATDDCAICMQNRDPSAFAACNDAVLDQSCADPAANDACTAAVDAAGCAVDGNCVAICPPATTPVLGACWVLTNFVGPSALAVDCESRCAGLGLLYDEATESVAGSGGTDANCQAVLTALGQNPGDLEEPSADCSTGLGCFTDIAYTNLDSPPGQGRCATPATDATSKQGWVLRACACK